MMDEDYSSHSGRSYTKVIFVQIIYQIQKLHSRNVTFDEIVSILEGNQLGLDIDQRIREYVN